METINFDLNNQDYEDAELLDEYKYNLKNTKKDFIIPLVYIAIGLSLSILKQIQFNSCTPITSPIFMTYFQSISFILFLPVSFILTQLENFFFKKKGSENEISSKELQNTMDDSFSEIMSHKFYENYYKYHKKFYLYVLYFSLLYYFSYLFYYAAFLILHPSICFILHSGIGLLISIYLIFFSNFKFSCFKDVGLVFLSAELILSFLVYVLIIYEKDVQFNSYKYHLLLGIILLILSDIGMVIIVIFLKKIIKSYNFYLNVGEFLGFSGLFSSLFIFVILFLQLVIKNNNLFKLYYTNQFILYEVVNVVSDFCLFSALKYCSRFSFSFIYTIEMLFIVNIFHFHKIAKGDGSQKNKWYLSLFELLFLLVSIIYLVLSIRQTQRMKVMKKIIAKKNNIKRIENYFN